MEAHLRISTLASFRYPHVSNAVESEACVRSDQLKLLLQRLVELGHGGSASSLLAEKRTAVHGF